MKKTNQQTTLAALVALFCSSPMIFAQDKMSVSGTPTTEKLDEIVVTDTNISDALVNTSVNRQQIFLKQSHDVKDIFVGKMDVNVSQLQGARSGGEGVNIRGLQANRVTTTIDDIPLPEAQEAKHFISYGSEFGRTDYMDVSALRSADVSYAGSANSLSGSVNFTTLEPQDLLKGHNLGGVVGTGYNSVDHSVYGSIGGAAKAGAYQGMVMLTQRKGHETQNQGQNSGVGATRTEPNPADTKNTYVLTKHYYQLDDKNKLGFVFEHQHKKISTDLLSLNNTNIDMRTGMQTTGYTQDKVNRDRFSLSHEYNSEKGWLQYAKTQIFYQDAQTENYRYRLGTRSYRQENSEFSDKSYGLVSNLISGIDGDIPQVLRYGLSYVHNTSHSDIHLVRPAYNQATNMYPMAEMRQDKFTGYLEDEIVFDNVAVTPQIGFVHYRIKPTSNDNRVAALKAHKQSETEFTPKISLEYRLSDGFVPYAQYSRGVRTPSPQQLSSYFFESVSYYIPGRGMQTANVAVVGNPNLKSETADNFEIGIKGKTSEINYLVTAYYNRYHNFIDWVVKPTNGYTSFIQYDNLDKAKVYGVTADVKWNFYNDFYTTAGFSYSRGKAENNGVKTPINSIQPMKTKLGVGYEGETFGANIQWTYNRGKLDKDIEQSSAYLYNPTGGYSLFDLGVYWKPTANLTFTANVNNIFDKKYWNWNDISYLALLSKATQDQGRAPSSIPMAITSANADRYSAPGRNFNIGVRYEF
ncbi:TonB-dependent hemoglobin/transferrin/lactoferrin family receptor [uncultured Haemophilus sp.]|uniref:TonB-dependent hemoglobin/transferrin/lactoferrin family receptor n=1 Tax=uncultured Haemophilus sp. TaxID=237779 RepID=UPI002805D7A6|nr:TonB-dependent hemoglobin/transferrin/lactoferrin family receptor [uncultured Haemophilus sp.]